MIHMSTYTPMRAVLKNLFKGPMTLKFPYEKLDPVEGYRGRQLLDISKCIGCGNCARACPNNAVEMVELKEEFLEEHPEHRGEPGGRVIRYPEIHLGKCCYCELCVENCPKGALTMTAAAMISVMDKSEARYGPERLSKPE